MNNAGRHIFLCGFMGCGKTTHGKKLASKLKIPFIDLDQLIEKGEDKKISEIFSEKGEPYFRELETRYLEGIMASTPQVISLGGGTVCFNNNLNKTLQNGILVYIEMSASALAQRLKTSTGKRPLLKQMKDKELLEFITKKLEERTPFYEKAHLRINGMNLNPEQLHHAVEEFIRQKG